MQRSAAMSSDDADNPGENDTEGEITEIASWLAGVDKDITCMDEVSRHGK